LNKKVRKLGVRHALSQKLLEGNLVVLDHMNLESHKTRRLEEMVARFGVGKNMSSALFIDDAEDAVEDFNDGEKKPAGSVYGGLNVNFKVASGNLQKIKVLNQLGCNVYDMLKFEKLFLTLSAVRALEERLQRDL
jgi:large subunit ribosomal protein L4